jgi:hypothetical protein
LALALTLVTCGISAVLILFLFDTTDVPYVRNLPSIPGLPIFGSLIQLGVEHPKRLAELSKKYGPVYQMRLGNRVCQLFSKDLYTCTEHIYRDSLWPTPSLPLRNCGSRTNQILFLDPPYTLFTTFCLTPKSLRLALRPGTSHANAEERPLVQR